MNNAEFVVLKSLQRFVSQYIRSNLSNETTVPRLAVFPKRVYELSFHEDQTPSGLSVAYVTMAAELNRQEAANDLSDDPMILLMRLLEAEVAMAATNERRIIQYLSEDHETSDH
jgi:hypothetical protein